MMPLYISLQIVPSSSKIVPGVPDISPIILIKSIFAISCITPVPKSFSYSDLAKDPITKSQLLQKLASQLCLLLLNSKDTSPHPEANGNVDQESKCPKSERPQITFHVWK